MKICKTCNVLKDLNDYYKHSRMADGHLNTCNDCHVDWHLNNKPLNGDKGLY